MRTAILNSIRYPALFFLFVMLSFVCVAQNAIVTENALPGNPSSEWDISGAGDLSIQGFATDISVNIGTRVDFKIKTNANAYAIKIYRLGYYQGKGARLVGTGTITASLPQIQPTDNYITSTGTTECSNWLPSAFWDVPSNAVSGIYIAKLTRSDNNGSSHIIFIVRDDAGNAPILFKTSDATWQAYNNYGGNSLYVNNSGTTVPGFNHATKVSYNRPFYTRNGNGGGGAMEDWLFNAEYPMIRWLERNGYPVSYTTDVDMDRSAVNITPSVHKVLLSVGHDEYWSAASRARFENARDAGVHLAFFSGNEMYWKTRWEDNHRTLVCYKEGTQGENTCGGKCDPLPNTWTGLWRDGCSFSTADGCNPENALTGQISWDGTTAAIQVPDTYKQLSFWRNTSIATLSPGQTATFPDGTLGYEWDWAQPAYANKNPGGRTLLSSTTVNGHTHNLSLYQHSSGAMVFGAGTVQWSWGLDSKHDRGNNAASRDMQQATFNLLADMGVEAASPQTELITVNTPLPTEGTGGPILLISTTTNPFGRYTVELLRAEGLNEFDAVDVSAVTTNLLNNHDVVILGEMPVSAFLVTQLTNWVNAGGTLIAFKPTAALLPLLGLTAANGKLTDQYLLVNNSGAGKGIVHQTIQFHGTSNLYTLSSATAIANLYSSAITPTNYAAVSSRNVGANGGKAIAFSYDLAKSVVYTRQGNPSWAGQSRDAQDGPIRSDNLFFPDWIDFNKIAIPQADEQQHLLTNLILQNNLHRKPLPRFWFLPRKLKAAVVMTGDDHGSNGTIARFNQFLAYGNNSAQDILDWKAVRATSYIYSSTDNVSTITNAQAAAFEAQGFEVAAHITTNCGNWTSQSDLDNNYFTPQLIEFSSKWPGVSTPVTNRTHCIAWSDWASHPKVEASKGMRLDVNYYYWPQSWMANRPGMFTGSGMPMRFADADGSLIDCYQVPTQITDESNMNYTAFCNAVLDKAIGTEGYYGVFATNMHSDNGASAASADAIIASAIQRQIPVISSKQLLTWLDGRDASHFDSITFAGNNLSFKITAAAGAYKLQGMLPVGSGSGQLTGINYNGAAISFSIELIKGMNYAFFDALTGDYTATYQSANTPPVISNITAITNNNGNATISWTTDKVATSKLQYAISPKSLISTVASDSLVASHSVVLSNLLAGATYHYRVSSADANNNDGISPAAPDSLSFTMPAPACVADDTKTDFDGGTPDENTVVVNDNGGAIIVRPALNESFDGGSVPAGFVAAIWDGQAGAITNFNGGLATVNGTHIYSGSSYGPGTTLEFSASFSQGNFQNIGFAGDDQFNNPWVTIGRGGEGDNTVYARNSDGQKVSLGTGLLNALHHYKIVWQSGIGSFEFYVDGSLVPTPGITQTVGGNMILQISDFPAGGAELGVDWLRISPYASAGNFESRVFDAGSEKEWVTANWQADLPQSTSLNAFVRKGNIAIPDGSWTAYAEVQQGDSVGGSSRYIQYKVALASADPTATPALNNFSISCKTPEGITPPLVSNVGFSIVEEGFVNLTKNNFNTAFAGVGGDSLVSVTITQLPLHGVLFLDNIPVQLNQEITGSSIDNLKYHAVLDYNGADSIGWNGAGTTGYAITPAFINIQISPVNDAPVITITSPGSGSIFSAGSNITVTTNATDVDGNISKVEFFYVVNNVGVKLSEITAAPYQVTGQQVEPALYPVYAKATDNNGSVAYSDTINISVTGCTPTGSIFGEGFTNITGTQVADMTANVNYPNSPSVTAQLNTFEYSNMGDNYGGRLRGYICAPLTGNYTFYIAGDDQAGIFLSTDENPANKVLIAYNINPVGFRAWTATATQKSVPVTLIKGARYYVETQHKQSTGTNHMSVGWTLPNGVSERPILGNRLSPFAVSGLNGRVAVPDFAVAMQSNSLSGLSVKASPNPTYNYFTLITSSNSEQPLTITVTDVLGRMVEKKEKIAANGSVQLGSKLSKGVYFVEVVQGTNRQKVKLIKQ
jgi:hypothetical protein